MWSMRASSALALALVLIAGAAQAQEASPPSAAPPATPAPPAGSGAQGDKAAEAEPPKQAGPVGGYSWSDKPAKRRARRAVRKKLDPDAPLATYPGFRTLPGRKSVVWLYVNKKVPVDVRKAAGRVVYVLTGVQVGIRNNTNPLVTHYFDTPLSRAQLRAHKDGAELVLELRENVEPTHRVLEGPRGMMILQVELPPASKNHAAQPLEPRDAKQGQVLVPGDSQTRRSSRGARP